MAILNWRGAEAPDFRGSMEGLRLAGTSMDRAFTGLVEGLGRFDTSRREQAESQLLNQASAFSDPAALRAAIADGSVFAGIDRALLGRTALGALDARAGTLLSQASAQEDLSFNRQANPRRLTGLDLANTGAALTNDGRRIANNFEAAAAPIRLDGMREQNRGQVLANEGRTTTNARGTFELTRDQATYADQQAGITAAEEALRRAVPGPRGAEDAAAYLESQNLSGPARAIARAAIEREFPNAYGAPAAAPAAGGTGTGAARTGTNGATAATPASRSGSVPLGSSFAQAIPFAETRDYVARVTRDAGDVRGRNHQETADRLLPHLIRHESGGDPNAVSPRGATGLTQVMPATGVDPGFGVRPMQNNSPEEQRRFARDYLAAMLQRYDGNVEMALAAYNAGPARVDEWRLRSNESIRREQATTAATAARTGADAQVRAAQNNAPGIAAQYSTALQSTSTMDDVVRELRKPGGIFEGITPARLTEHMNEIMQMDRRINPATAAALLTRFAQGNPAGWVARQFGGRDAIDIDRRGLRAEVQALTDGSRYEGNRSTAGATAVNTALTDAMATYEAANNELLQARERATVSPAARESLPRYEARAQEASRRMREILDRAQARPDRQPEWTAPVGASTGGSAPSSTAPGYVPGNVGGPSTLPPAPVDTGAAPAAPARTDARVTPAAYLRRVLGF